MFGLDNTVCVHVCVCFFCNCIFTTFKRDNCIFLLTTNIPPSSNTAGARTFDLCMIITFSELCAIMTSLMTWPYFKVTGKTAHCIFLVLIG